MDIRDLYRTKRPKTDFRRPDTTAPTDDSVLGVGVQAMVYAHPRDKTKVVKVADIKDPVNDPYLEFVRLIVEHQDNPFYPKIYKAKLYEKTPDDRTLEEGKYRLVLIMERLYPIWDLKNNHPYMKAALEELASLGIPEEVTQEYIDSQEDPSVLWDYFEDENNIEDLIQYSDNHSFRKAMKQLHPYIRTHGQDMHMGNLMVRVAGGDVQIVIIDPLATNID